jgi:hypothetical protein
MMRRRGPGLIRAAATTAVVAGTATAVSGRVARRQDRRYMQEDYAQQQQAYAQQPQAYPQQPYQPVADEPDYTDEIARLARLRAQDLITEDEFDAKKKQILGI